MSAWSRPVVLTDAEKKALYNNSTIQNLLKSAAEIKIDSEAVELPLKIEKYFKQEKLANKVVAKWFNRQDDGSFDWNLIADRGVLSASFLETKTAQASSEGQAILKTAGLLRMWFWLRLPRDIRLLSFRNTDIPW